MNSSNSLRRTGFGLAPIIALTTSPLWKTLILGIELTPYCIANCGSSSVLILTILILFEYSLEISSNTGATARHGPHHSAQKSTITGTLLSNTTLLKFAEVTFQLPFLNPPLIFDVLMILIKLLSRYSPTGIHSRKTNYVGGIAQHQVRPDNQILQQLLLGDMCDQLNPHKQKHL